MKFPQFLQNILQKIFSPDKVATRSLYEDLCKEAVFYSTSTVEQYRLNQDVIHALYAFYF